MRPCARLDQEAAQCHIKRMVSAVEDMTMPFLRYFRSRISFIVKHLIVILSNQPLPPPLSQRIPDQATIEHVYAPQALPVYSAKSLSRNQFLHLWTAGIPVVIKEAQKNFQGHWDPQSFIDHYGKLWVTPIDCGTDQARSRMAVSEFFALLLERSGQQAAFKLKVSLLVALSPTQPLTITWDTGLAT